MKPSSKWYPPHAMDPFTQQLHTFFHSQRGASSHAAFLGGSPSPSALNRWSLIGLAPRQILSVQHGTLRLEQFETPQTIVPATTIPPLTSTSDLLTACRAMQKNCIRHAPVALEENRCIPGQPVFTGGVVGLLAYEAYPWLTPGAGSIVLKNHGTPTAHPDILLVEYHHWLLADLQTGDAALFCGDPKTAVRLKAAWQQAAANRLQPDVVPSQSDADWLKGFDASLSESEFEAAVEKLKQAIHNGTVYQANLSLRLQREMAVDEHALYQQLCRSNPSPFSALLCWPQGRLVCNSPERLVRTTADGTAETRPIAGTRGRANQAESDLEDIAIGEKLLANPKERAEHMMLVDLARNDLGQVCRAGTVQVEELLTLERYSHVTHLVSSVRGEVADHRDAWDVLCALFPGGTITGCPKLRCMEVLARTEPVPRQYYTGSVFTLDAATGCLDANIIIRSLLLSGDGYNKSWQVSLHAGAGIVADSHPAHEYRECMRKATAMLEALHSQTFCLTVPQPEPIA